MLLSFANAWPSLMNGLSTTDPVVTQVALRIGAVLVGGVLAALFLGLMAAVSSYAMRSVPPQPLSRFAPWTAGVAAALAVAGFASLLAAFAPQLAPRWPSLGTDNAALPPLAALLNGVGYLRQVTLALFVLFVLQRITSNWTRRVWLVMLLLMLLYALPAALGAGDAAAALASGLASGLIATAVVLWLFRFDPRALPAYVAAMMTLDAAVSATQQGSAQGWLWFALCVAVYVALTLVVTRWISRPLGNPAFASTR